MANSLPSALPAARCPPPAIPPSADNVVLGDALSAFDGQWDVQGLSDWVGKELQTSSEERCCSLALQLAAANCYLPELTLECVCCRPSHPQSLLELLLGARGKIDHWWVGGAYCATHYWKGRDCLLHKRAQARLFCRPRCCGFPACRHRVPWREDRPAAGHFRPLKPCCQPLPVDR